MSYGKSTFLCPTSDTRARDAHPTHSFYRGANLNSGPHACATGTSHGTNPYSHTQKSEKYPRISVDIFSIFHKTKWIFLVVFLHWYISREHSVRKCRQRGLCPKDNRVSRTAYSRQFQIQKKKSLVIVRAKELKYFLLLWYNEICWYGMHCTAWYGMEWSNIGWIDVIYELQYLRSFLSDT